MKTGILPKIKIIWDRFRWYIIAALFILLAVLVFTFLTDDKDTYKEMTKWMVKKKGESLDRRLNYLKGVEGENDKEVERIEKEIDKVRETRKEIDDDVDSRGVSELSKAFKHLGY